MESHNGSRTQLDPLATAGLCPVCDRPVFLATAHTDEHGHAIHEECYLLKVRLEQHTREES